MHTLERIPVMEGQVSFRWSRFLWQTVLSCGGTMAITGILFVLQLYPRIPNISIVYLLVILLFAIIFGRYASLLSSLVASLSFDFFLVPPLYTFTMARWEEWVALFIFLVTALAMSQVTLGLRYQRNQAHTREREARILYELIRLTNSREGLEDQLEVVLLSLAHVFAAWGIYACALLLPDSEGALSQLIDVSSPEQPFSLSREELLLAIRAMVNGKVEDQSSLPQPGMHDKEHHVQLYYDSVNTIDILRLVPLRSGSQMLGVLCLRIQHPALWFVHITLPPSEQNGTEDSLPESDEHMNFFWTYLEQATSILERARLRAEIRPWTR